MGKSKFWYFCTQKYPKTNFWGRKYQFWVVLRPNRPKFGKSNMWTFSKKNPSLNGYSFLIYPHFCENWPDPKKTTFSHFLQNTVLDPKRHKILKIFEKFRFWAFRKVYGLWGYFRPKKSYSYLKFQHTTVTHLCFGFTYDHNSILNAVNIADIYRHIHAPYQNCEWKNWKQKNLV